MQTSGSLLTYDGASRIRSAQAGSRQAGMAYDPFGRLSSLRTSDGQTERRATFLGLSSSVAFFSGSGDPVEVGPQTARLHRYTDITIDSPVGAVAALRRSDAGQTAILYPLGEPQGTRHVFDGSGAATQAIDNDSYGNVLSDSGTAASLTFFPYQWNGGHVLDGLGLTALGARVLDSRTGRFLQRDPVITCRRQGPPIRTRFAWNNPTAFVDRTGADPERVSEHPPAVEPGAPDPLSGFSFSFLPFGRLSGYIKMGMWVNGRFTVDSAYRPPAMLSHYSQAYKGMDALERWENYDRDSSRENFWFAGLSTVKFGVGFLGFWGQAASTTIDAGLFLHTHGWGAKPFTMAERGQEDIDRIATSCTWRTRRSPR